MMEQEIMSFSPVTLGPYFACLQARPAWRWQGRTIRADGQVVESEGPLCSVGESCEVVDSVGQRHPAEVIGFRGKNVLVMPLQTTQGVRYGDAITALGSRPGMMVGEEMAGCVFDACGNLLSEGPAPRLYRRWSLDGIVPGAMERMPIRTALSTGIRAIDAMLTVGCGQRIGVFGGSGVGKSTLVGMMTRNTAADITVVGLVGERGREVREFLEDALGEEGRRRSVVVVSTSDQSPLLRMRAALSATSIAEFYASQGKQVLLVLDSLTRYAMAAREVGLAAGEPPASKGYTPSVFTRLAKLVERAGNFGNGSITAFYSVLMEGDDQQDPIVDAVRSFLDGHVILSRNLAAAGHYPPIDMLSSVSRLMTSIISPEHRERSSTVRRLLATYARSEDLVRIGAYKAGGDQELDRAIAAVPLVQQFLRQRSEENVILEGSLQQLLTLEL